jgi:FkbM family methyltransferase
MNEIKPWTEELRYAYSLTKNSIVWDVGGFMGNFAKDIYTKYSSQVTVFEPVFHERVTNFLKPYFPDIKVLPIGLGATTRTETFAIGGDSTGLFLEKNRGEQVTVNIQSIEELFDKNKGIDLLKLNCEGMEFEILESILNLNFTPYIKNIQVQFHSCTPDHTARYADIAEKLKKTHFLTYRTPWIWENWQLRE